MSLTTHERFMVKAFGYNIREQSSVGTRDDLENDPAPPIQSAANAIILFTLSQSGLRGHPYKQFKPFQTELGIRNFFFGFC